MLEWKTEIWEQNPKLTFPDSFRHPTPVFNFLQNPNSIFCFCFVWHREGSKYSWAPWANNDHPWTQSWIHVCSACFSCVFCSGCLSSLISFLLHKRRNISQQEYLVRYKTSIPLAQQCGPHCLPTKTHFPVSGLAMRSCLPRPIFRHWWRLVCSFFDGNEEKA